MSVNSPGGATLELTVWDAAGEPPLKASCVYLWNGHSGHGNAHSLLQYCELHAVRLRARYLAWIHDLGEVQVGKKSLIDHLAFEDGLSYWWMTLLVEKSPYKSPLTDAIRLLAVEEILQQNRVCKVFLASENRLLGEAMRLLCAGLGVAYEWKKPSRFTWRFTTATAAFRRLPNSIQALISLARYVWTHRPTRGRHIHGWCTCEKSLFFCSYFFNFSIEHIRSGGFRSRYWGGLHRLIGEMKLCGNWLHLYAPHDAVPDIESAHALVQSINLNDRKEGVHALLEAYFNWAMVFRVVKRWIWLNLLLWRLRGIERELDPLGPSLFLWSLMREDWRKSLVGTFAINNLWSIELFDAALKDIPLEKQGFYLCENQSWERALVHAWHKHGHGQLVAVPHSTVRFWDMRYFSDPRAFQASGQHPMPRPHLTALNGKAAFDAYSQAGYPRHEMVESEALRFEYLNKLQPRERSTNSTGASLRVLILGEYSPSSTLRLLELIEMAVSKIPWLTLTIKPHPNYIVEARNHPLLNLNVVTDPLETILGDFDMVYSGNMTSAAVDAYLSGLPVVVLLDTSELNFSPLRDSPGVCFVSTPEELAVGLQVASHQGFTPRARDEFFFLDSQYPRWKELLQQSFNSQAV